MGNAAFGPACLADLECLTAPAREHTRRGHSNNGESESGWSGRVKRPVRTIQWIAAVLRIAGAYAGETSPCQNRQLVRRWTNVSSDTTRQRGASGAQPPSDADPKRSPVRELDVVLDALPAMVGYWDAQLRNVVANAAYVDFFGRTPGELKGLHIGELLGEELYAKNEPHIRAALAGEPQLFDREIIDPTGTPRYTQASYMPDIVDGEVRGFSVLVTDITARRIAERAAASAQARFQALFDLAPTGKFLIDASGVIVDANRAAGELLQLPADTLVGRSIEEFIPEEERGSSADLLARLLAGERIIGVERQYIRADGTRMWAQMDAASVRVPGEPALILAQIQDVGARREERTALARLAMHDPLTGLLNRRGFLACLAETARGSVVVVDLDEFKAVNDELGHQAGDDVLIAVAEILQDRVRDEDAVGRLGGDEFMLVLSHARADEAERVADDLTTRIAEARLGLPDRPVRASAGVAAIAPEIDPEALIAQADREMYAQKARGRRQEPEAR